ncbi:unnamed protein product [Amoebophrya sp. A25]|nr:unnamed protein product [Amoebophrya sp. A25]|eukprot:GSA25T00016358001.1
MTIVLQEHDSRILLAGLGLGKTEDDMHISSSYSSDRARVIVVTCGILSYVKKVSRRSGPLCPWASVLVHVLKCHLHHQDGGRFRTEAKKILELEVLELHQELVPMNE